MTRPTWDQYFIDMLPLVAKRSTCLRRQLGAIIVMDNRIIWTGYNGPPSGMPHCETCNKDANNIASGSGQNMCYASHAELNAIAHCSRYGVATKDATIYISTTPCAYCAKAIVQAGVKRVVCAGIYPDKFAQKILSQTGVLLEIHLCRQ